MPRLVFGHRDQEVEAAVEHRVVGLRAQDVEDDHVHEAGLARPAHRLQVLVAEVEEEPGQDHRKALAAIVSLEKLNPRFMRNFMGNMRYAIMRNCVGKSFFFPR